jgi:putative RecB family exonuclease
MQVKPTRIQSPSSINTYKQCPRKYFYQYVVKIKTGTNIHLIRGSIAHKVLEDFFKIELKETEPLLGNKLIEHVNALYEKEWQDNKADLDSLGMEQSQLEFYYEETKNMVNLWTQGFLQKIAQENPQNPVQAFNKLKPRMEVLYYSDNYGVRGYIDVVEEIEDNVRLMDYKTSKKAKITDAYKLQLAIYALLYNEKHGKMPNKVGITFLKFGEDHEISVTKELLDLAELEIELVHMNTQFKNIHDYPKHETPLCKWSSGQCDFYEYCFEGKQVPRELCKDKECNEKEKQIDLRQTFNTN